MTRTRTVVASPQLREPGHSLVRAAITNLDGEAGWERGLTYAPETPGSYRAASGCSAQELDHTREAVPTVGYMPWELLVEDPCDRLWQYDRAEVTGRLRRAVAAVESFAIARELWTGELAKLDAAEAPDGDMAGNLYLGKAPEVVSAEPVSPKRGLGLLEQAAGEALTGGQAFLHVPRLARPYLPELVKTGDLLTTNIGNMIVADAGYPNQAPDGEDAPEAGVAWVYATGPVVVRRSPIQDDAEDAQIIDTETNRILRRAWRRVAATFDSAAHFACPITLT